MPNVLPSDEDGRRRMDVVRRLQELFGMHHGVRYLSPGLVMTSRDAVPDSPRGWVFTHDAAIHAHAMELAAPAIERFVP